MPFPLDLPRLHNVKNRYFLFNKFLPLCNERFPQGTHRIADRLGLPGIMNGVPRVAGELRELRTEFGDLAFGAEDGSHPGVTAQALPGGGNRRGITFCSIASGDKPVVVVIVPSMTLVSQRCHHVLGSKAK